MDPIFSFALDDTLAPPEAVPMLPVPDLGEVLIEDLHRRDASGNDVSGRLPFACAAVLWKTSEMEIYDMVSRIPVAPRPPMHVLEWLSWDSRGLDAADRFLLADACVLGGTNRHWSFALPPSSRRSDRPMDAVLGNLSLPVLSAEDLRGYWRRLCGVLLAPPGYVPQRLDLWSGQWGRNHPSHVLRLVQASSPRLAFAFVHHFGLLLSSPYTVASRLFPLQQCEMHGACFRILMDHWKGTGQDPDLFGAMDRLIGQVEDHGLFWMFAVRWAMSFAVRVESGKVISVPSLMEFKDRLQGLRPLIAAGAMSSPPAQALEEIDRHRGELSAMVWRSPVVATVHAEILGVFTELSQICMRRLVFRSPVPQSAPKVLDPVALCPPGEFRGSSRVRSPGVRSVEGGSEDRAG